MSKRCLTCDMKRAASVHLDGHAFLEETKYRGLRSIGGTMTRFNESLAGKAYRAEAVATRGLPCKVKSPRCTGTNQHLHEVLTRGRAGGIAAALRDGPPPIGSCDACNGFISEHPQWARERGWLLHSREVQS